MSQDPQSSAEVFEPTALEYARAHGLSRNYLKEALGSGDLLQLQGKADTSQLDSSHLPQLNLGLAPKVEERLNLSKNAALLLQSVIREETRADIDSLLSSILSTKDRALPRKLELPLLRSDHETDCRLFASRKGVDIKLQDVRLPLEIVGAEKNEGFVYPAAFWNMGPETLQKLKVEKLSASKKTLVYISECIKPCWTEDDAKALWDSEQKYKRVSNVHGSMADTNPRSRIMLSNLLHHHYRQHLCQCSNLMNPRRPILLTKSHFCRILYLQPSKNSKLLRTWCTNKTSRLR
jgi:hypothetical protein